MTSAGRWSCGYIGPILSTKHERHATTELASVERCSTPETRQAKTPRHQGVPTEPGWWLSGMNTLQTP